LNNLLESFPDGICADVSSRNTEQCTNRFHKIGEALVSTQYEIKIT
jgi:hypothetical protein